MQYGEFNCFFSGFNEIIFYKQDMAEQKLIAN